jgi:hypothetical protein
MISSSRSVPRTDEVSAVRRPFQELALVSFDARSNGTRADQQGCGMNCPQRPGGQRPAASAPGAPGPLGAGPAAPGRLRVPRGRAAGPAPPLAG